MSERSVVVTEDDVRFVERAVQHYQIFAEASERQAGKEARRTAGILRKQQFYAQRFLIRLRAPEPNGERDET